MRVHHLNCATLCPPCSRLVNGEGALFSAATLVCHCLLIETERDGLILVDSGLSTQDVRKPTRLPARFRRLSRPRLDLAEAAATQLPALGFRRQDVRHIVVTHLDLDHAGGIADFPHATVHVHAVERAAAAADPRRYVQAQFAAHKQWALYDHEHGETWKGIAALQPLRDVHAEIALLPLFGHSKGHCGVLVGGSGSLLAAGDAYFHRNEVRGGSVPLGLRLFARSLSVDDRLRRRNVLALRELARDVQSWVQTFCAHDPQELAALVAASARDESRAG